MVRDMESSQEEARSLDEFIEEVARAAS